MAPSIATAQDGSATRAHSPPVGISERWVQARGAPEAANGYGKQVARGAVDRWWLRILVLMEGIDQLERELWYARVWLR